MAELIARFAVSLSQIPEVRLAIRTTVVLAVALALLSILRHARASLRALVLTSAFAVLALMPLAATVLSPVSFSVPIAATQTAIAPRPAARISIPSAVTGEPRVDHQQAGWITWRHLTGAAWSAGIVFFLLPMALGWWRLAALHRQAVTWPGGDRMARELARIAGVRRAPRVLLHRGVAGPVTYGVISPVVLMPGTATGWRDAEIRRALTHELEHLARADWPTQVAVRIICAFYWWQPLTWVAWRRLRLEAERACDDAVLQDAEPGTYAAQLVRIARQVSAPGMASVVSMASRTDLSRRVSALLDVHQARGRLDLRMKLAALMLAVGVTLLVAPLSALQGRREGAPAAARSGNNLIVTVRDPIGRLAAEVPLLLENTDLDVSFVGGGFTDRNGQYQFRVPPGSYLLTAPVEFFPAVQISVRAGEVTEQTVRMEIESTTATFTVCIDCSGSESYAPPASIVDEFRNDREAPLNDLVVGAEPEVGWEFYQPQAPDALRRLGAAAPTGTVIVEGYIATDGRVRDLRAVLATYPALASAATASLRETRWRPARVGGTPVEVPLRITFEYTREAR